MKVKIFAPSYKRPEKSITQTTYPCVKIVVKESEADEYIKNGNDVVICPDSAQGNLCRVRNWILDNCYDDADCIVLLDDDCRGVGRWMNQNKIIFDEKQFIDFVSKSADLCDQFNFKFFGLNCIPDGRAYREYTPFSFVKYIGGPFQGHLKDSKIRYDENLPLKEDYDITLQHVYKHGGALRINYAHYEVKQAEQEGGCATYRNLEREREQFFLLQKKWGKDIIRRDKKSSRSFDFNPIMKIPVKSI
jgi:hypothetical protein